MQRCKLLLLLFFYCSIQGWAQAGYNHSAGPTASYLSFVDYQRSFPRPQEAMQRKLDTLKKQFVAKKLKWPVAQIYIRSFKYDSHLEVWVKQTNESVFSLFKTYPVCALGGSLGPKRVQGDYQVPEGFYYINEFNPFSNYYLSLGLNYPNASDRMLSDSSKPGGDIYIHGSCVTVGCIPITDQQIDELYILATFARDAGQDFIPVHIFPCRFDVPKSKAYLDELTKDDPVLFRFSEKLADAYFYFEKNKKLPIVMIAEDGQYYINDAPRTASATRSAISASLPTGEITASLPRSLPSKRVRTIVKLSEVVDQWPQFPGGITAFNDYLDQTSSSMRIYLPAGFVKVYVQFEFVVDRDGVPVNFKIIKGLANNLKLEALLIEKLEQMSIWKPAKLNGVPVAKKLTQTLVLQK
ncbi:MAG: hypothetical protein FJY19_01140 [Bacteroidetes bacterium]|nr:hypothetical protein [Bacteroidota bacterium]